MAKYVPTLSYNLRRHLTKEKAWVSMTQMRLQKWEEALRITRQSTLNNMPTTF